MPDFDVQRVVEAAAKAIWEEDGALWERLTVEDELMAEDVRTTARAALAVIVPAVTAQVRALHAPMVIEMPAMSDLTWCSHCPGGTNYPCPTVRLLDALDAAVRGEES